MTTPVPTTITPNVNESGLIAYWKFDEGTGTTACDSSGNGNTASLVNGPMWTTGKVGKALYFDGIDDNVTAPGANSLNLTNFFTLSAWVNPASTFSDFRSILVKNYKYYLYASSAGYCADGSPLGGFSEVTNQTVCQPSPLLANNWTHVTMTYNGSTQTLYMNGIEVATSNVSGSLSSTTGPLQIGASQYGEYFKGFIDEVRIYNRALTAKEIQTTYQQEAVDTSSIVATPIISPNGGSYSGSVSLTMQSATSGASIYYTTNGSTPTQSSTLYNGAMTLTSTATVKAKSFKNGYNPGNESSASFTILQPFNYSLASVSNTSVVAGSSVTRSISTTPLSGSTQPVSFSASGLPTAATASFSPASCSSACSTVLTIVTNGSTPAGDFPITVTSSGGGVTKTTAFTLSVTLALTVATPTIAPNGGNFSGPVSIQTTTSGASIYYTTDGSTPSQSSRLYSGPVTVTGDTTVNAKAFKSGYNPSALAAASFTNTESGTSYYVAKTGSDSNSCAQARSASSAKLTINAGIACLASGNILIIKAGTYDEIINSQIRQSIPSGGSWSSPTTIKAAPGETVIMRPTSSSVTATIYLGDQYHHIVFDGLILDGNGASTRAGMTMKYDTDPANAPHHIRVRNTEFKNFVDSGLYIFGTGYQLLNNKVHDNGKDCTGWALGPGHCHGFYVSSSDTLIEGNDVYSNEGYGLHLYPGTGGDLSGTILRNNLIHDNGVGGAAGVGASAGIVLSGGTGIQAYNNIIWRNTAGIQIQYGVYDSFVYNNTIYDNSRTAPSTPNYCVYIGSDTVNTVFRNNICYQNSAGIIDASSSAVKSNNLMTDPRFIDAASGIFQLQNGSPAINAGTTITMISDDYNGVLRPQGGAFDIGAYEYAIVP